MQHLSEMMTFAKVVETRSFSAAALAMNTSKSLVSKQISTLEQALGVRLLVRTTRRMSVTEIGAAFYEHCARIVQEADAAARTVSQLQAEPRGVLRITSPVVFGALHLAAAMRDFLEKYPQVEIELNATDRALDLMEEGYDVAIRISSDPPANMVARHIAPLRWLTCAAPSYLERCGTPELPQDLLKHECLVFHGPPAPRGGWAYQVNGKRTELPVKGRCRVNSSDVLLQMALDGMGIVLSPAYVLNRYLRTGQLQEILPDSVAYPGMALYAVYMPNRYMQPKVRAFIDHLLGWFRERPW